jgi:hypothetical protein
MAKKKVVKQSDILSSEELAIQLELKDYIPGHPYVWVMDFGWCYIGYYIRHSNPLVIRVAHKSHFRNAKRDYGKLITEGSDPDCEWRYQGHGIISVPHIISCDPYFGSVHRGNVLLA